jgi:superfamily II DNA or RNA helicase
MVSLRPYQIHAIASTYQLFAQKVKSVLVCVPTGGGKTTIAAEIVQRAVKKQSKVLFIAHREELITQAHARLAKFGILAGIMMGKYNDKYHDVIVGSVQTLVRRELPKDINLIIIDEAHHATSDGYVKIIQNYPNAYVIGLTATPERMDGKSLQNIFQELVEVISINDLIKEGFLVESKTFAAKESVGQKELKEIKTVNGDYNSGALYEKFNKPTLYKGVVENYLKHSNNKKAIVFNINCEHSRKTCEEFNNQGVKAMHLDADVDSKTRKQILDDFAANKFNVLCNVGILTEGYDLPAIETVILNRATKSVSLYFQMIGRGLRPYGNKKHCLVIDHGNNWLTHGFVTHEREWQWKGRKKKGTGAFPVKECKDCGEIVHAAIPICPSCGYVFPKNEKEVKDTDEFVEVVATVKTLPKGLKSKSPNDMTVEELELYRDFKNYKIGWIIYKFREKSDNDIDKLHKYLAEYAALKKYKPSWVLIQLKNITSNGTPNTV